jgi:two-component system, chemotaxis family, CheB/CheR fusion protein
LRAGVRRPSAKAYNADQARHFARMQEVSVAARRGKQPTRRQRRRPEKAPAANPAAAPPPPDPAEVSASFPVVGVGASAGGFEAFSELLSHLPSDIPMAIVLVQHLDPKHSSLLTELLTRATPLPVVEARQGIRVEPAHVYVIPPNTTLTIVDDALQTSPREPGSALHMPVDTFFRSLAESRGERAIGVVLSGGASDGALGIKAIKGEGGVTFAQDPQTAGQDGMPRSAIASGAVDFVLPPRGIAQELARIGGHPYLRDPSAPMATTEPRDEGAIEQIFRMLRQDSGVDFRLYRQTTVRRRIARRMLVHKIDTVDRYHRYLEEHPDELPVLFNEILINVTRFFRDPAAFNALQEAVVAHLAVPRNTEHPLRVWVPGCATGEEAYSVAIVLLEAMERAPSKLKLSLQLFGSDVSDAAIARARAGIYPTNIEIDVSPERLRRFFTKIDGQYQVKKSVRELCVFARHNLAKDPPFSSVDVISCRNVLIYLDGASQRRVMATFHYALRNSGLLMLGTSETVGPLSELFTVVDQAHKIYAAKATSTRFLPGFSLRERAAGAPATDRRPPARAEGPLPTNEVQREVERVLLGRYAPAGVLINEAYEILQFRGHTSPYLELPPGIASLNIIKMAREGLLRDLRTAIAAARRRRAPVRHEGLRLRKDRGFVLVDLEVIPVVGPGDKTNYLVLFEPALKSRRPAARGRQARLPAPAREESRLQQELTATKEFLQSIIEDREAANEELRSANEELQSANEELQSTNEELETAKEELQSVNEELTTVNDELQHRNEELEVVNNDLTNLISSANIPIVILGNDLRIRRFTPLAARLFNLLPADIGRPLAAVRSNLDVPDLEQLCAQVLDSITPITMEVRDRDGGWYSLSVRPYRTSDNMIGGVVLALFDISALKASLAQVATARDYAEAIVDTVRMPLVLLDTDFRIRTANRAFYETFQVGPESTVSRLLFDVGNGQWDIPALRRALADIAETGTPLLDFEVEHDFPHVGVRTMLLNARGLRQDAGTPPTVLLALEDITARRQAERDIRASEELRYRRLFETARDGIALLDADTGQITNVNPFWVSLTHREADAVIGRRLWEVNLFEDQETVQSIVRELQARSFVRYEDLVLVRPDGSRRHVELACNVYRLAGKRVLQCIARDMTDRVELLQRERKARAEAEAANRAKDDFLSVLSHELRTPLTAMLGWARVLRTGALEPSRTADALETVERNTRLLAQLIDDLLDVSRIAAGKLAIEMQRVDLGAVVRAATETVRESAEAKGLGLHVGVPETSPIVRGDRRRLQQVLLNLLSNAVKFTPRGGRIDVKLESMPSAVRLTVSDTGRGMPPSFLPQIFDRFRQFDAVGTRAQGGLGLGLAIVRHLVELHGGRVAAFSAGEGLGSTFTVDLPPLVGDEVDAAASEATAESQIATNEVRLAGLHVLVVEDDVDTGRMVGEVLGERGATVIHVESAAEALAAMARAIPDVLISDIGMPGEDGYELIRRVRTLPAEVGGHVPAIALTAFAREEDRQHALEAGFTVHVAKPIDPAALAGVVAAVSRVR